MNTFKNVLFVVLSIFVGTSCAHPRPVRSEHIARAPLSESSFRIATVQYPMEGDLKLSALTLKLEAFVRDAKAQGAGLVIFPELIALDSWPAASKDSEEKIVGVIADQITPNLFREVGRMSREHNIAILAGSAPRRVGTKIRNTSLLSFSDGKTTLHDKVFLTAWERKMGWEAGSEVKAFDAPWGKTVVLICYDVEFPVMAETLAKIKPEVLLVPSMTESDAGLQRVRWSAQARAVELHSFVVVSGTVGKIGEDWVHYGQNVILSPRERLFPEAPIEGTVGKPGIVFADLDLPRLRLSREKSDFFPARDQENRPLRIRDQTFHKVRR